MTKLQDIHHLLSRAAFGPAYRDISSYSKLSTKELVHKLFDSSSRYSDLDIVDIDFIPFNRLARLTEEEKKALRKKAREQILELNKEWFVKMSTTEAVFREKMTLFWHDHFACRTKSPLFAQDLNNILRRHALGNFGEMLMAVSKSPAMIQYLNNQQNKAKSPNENFAREVMELFTLGRNNYTEEDIKSAARAFTGWGFNQEGGFVFKRKQHDFGVKTVLGVNGNLGGEEVIDIILDKRQTAKYITEKFYKYFVNEQINHKHLDKLATGFYNSGYNIGELMKQIFTSDWFYEPENRSRIIKSPVELLVGYARILPFKKIEKKNFLHIQGALGQVLFMPPNVGGWPYGEEWINSTSIIYRMQLPYTFISPPKGSKKRKLAFNVDWPLFYTETNSVNTEELAILILGKQPDDKEQALIAKATQRFQEKTARKAVETVSWLCLPDYQLA